MAHIIDKHGDDIKALGFSLGQFIPILVKYGDLAESKDPDKIILKGNNFKIIISKKAYKNRGETLESIAKAYRGIYTDINPATSWKNGSCRKIRIFRQFPCTADHSAAKHRPPAAAGNGVRKRRKKDRNWL